MSRLKEIAREGKNVCRAGFGAVRARIYETTYKSPFEEEASFSSSSVANADLVRSLARFKDALKG